MPLPRSTALLAWLCAAVVAAEAPSVPGPLVEFGPASPMALFSGGGPDAWDRDLRERGWIIRDGGGWRLWYTGSNPDRDSIRRLGLATSPDGLTWTRAVTGPLVADLWIEDVCVVKARTVAGERWRMVAEGAGDVAHLLASRDGVRWRSCGPLDIRRASGGPIPDGPRGTPTLWFDHGCWHLFYERWDDGVWLATSRDFRIFTNVCDEPVLACGPERYDRHGIAIDQIVRFGGRFYAYYHASPDQARATWQTCLAASDDLVRWTKCAANPIVAVDPCHPKRSSATVVFDGDRLRLYTTHPDVRVRFSVDRVAEGCLGR